MLKNRIVVKSFNMKNFVQIVIIIGLSVLLFNQCDINVQKEKAEKHNAEVLKDTISYYENGLGLEVAQKLAFKGTAADLQLLLEQKEMENKQLSLAVKKFKKLASVTDVKTVTEIKEVPVPFAVEVACDFERKFLKEDPFYKIEGYVNEKGLNFETISLTNQLTLVVGKKNVGFFKSEFRAEVTNSNPYIKTTSLDNFTFTERKKRFGVGVSFGFGVYSKGFFIGPSINYNILQF